MISVIVMRVFSSIPLATFTISCPSDTNPRILRAVLRSQQSLRTDIGEVIAIGEGRVLNNGQLLVPNVKVNDKVLYNKFAGTEVNIDGEEHYKEIKVVQGDVVTYEEDFTGITYTGDAWEDDFNENYTNGKAKQTDSTNSSKGIEFQYLGKGCEVISRVNEDTGYIRISENDMILKYREVDSNGEELFQVNITREVLEDLEYGTHKIQILQAKSAETPWGNMFYIDAIKIYK